MDPSVFSSDVQVLIQYGYLAMFLAMLVEGPIITAAGAFAAALGYMDIWIVLLLSILGNLIPDVIYYAIGYWGRHRLIDRYGHYFHIKKELIAKIEELAKKHAWKALSLIKLTSVLATPGLIIIGSMRMPIRKYAWICIAITAPSSLFFFIVGYYFGAAYDRISQYFEYGGYTLAGAIILIVLIGFLWKKFSVKVAEEIGSG
ncbi:MAG: DedA family protein [Candidatus Liptonbacteria bacterium]|nr:DedA family protein [Candidatus Liptonbacteria bacterium]